MKFAIDKKIIRDRMKAKGWRPEDLASHAGIAYTTALKALKGRSVSQTVYKAIASSLDLPEKPQFGNDQASKLQPSALNEQEAS
jgi:transcriptional regulator with XRE-family HTH domain